MDIIYNSIQSTVRKWSLIVFCNVKLLLKCATLLGCLMFFLSVFLSFWTSQYSTFFDVSLSNYRYWFTSTKLRRLSSVVFHVQIFPHFFNVWKKLKSISYFIFLSLPKIIPVLLWRVWYGPALTPTIRGSRKLTNDCSLKSL